MKWMYTENGIHRRQIKGNATMCRQHMAFQGRACAKGNDRCVRSGTDFKNFWNFFGTIYECNRIGGRYSMIRLILAMMLIIWWVFLLWWYHIIVWSCVTCRTAAEVDSRSPSNVRSLSNASGDAVRRLLEGRDSKKHLRWDTYAPPRRSVGKRQSCSMSCGTKVNRGKLCKIEIYPLAKKGHLRFTIGQSNFWSFEPSNVANKFHGRTTLTIPAERSLITLRIMRMTDALAEEH